MAGSSGGGSQRGGGPGRCMALEDPFSAVRGEVQTAVNAARGLYRRWGELLRETRGIRAEEFDWTTNELRSTLRSLEWDLEDLEETNGIVESNPRKFRIEASELAERQAFVGRMRDSVKEMRDHISSPSALAFAERKNREMLTDGGASQKPPPEQYGPPREELVSANSRYIEEQQLHQQHWLLHRRTPPSLTPAVISPERMLEEFAQEMDNTQTHMDGVLKKMAKVSHMTSDRRQWCAICILLVLLIVVLILLFTL